VGSPARPSTPCRPRSARRGWSQTSERLLVSRDGITWSDQTLDKLAGSAIADISNLVVTANRFIVAVLLNNGQRPQPEAVLVGTAR
jgi:hypothetical protein